MDAAATAWVSEPPLRRAPRQVVVLLGAKLIGLDTILPVIFELKAESPGLDIRFLFLSGAALEEIRGNYVLIDGMTKIGRIQALSPGKKGAIAKARTAARLAVWLASLARKRSLLLGYTDFGRFPFNLLAAAARRRGAAVLYAKAAFPESEGFRCAMAERYQERDLRYRDGGDALLLYHPGQIEDLVRYTDCPALIAGTPRNLPAWRRHLDETARTCGITDDTGRSVRFGDRPVFVLFYPGNHVLPTLAKPTSCRDQLRRFLAALRAEAPDAALIIKPHAICDRGELAAELADFPDLVVAVTHAHPQLLASRAAAAVFVNGSNVMNDMYMEGVPVIELSDYRADILDSVGTLYPDPLRRPARTPKAMRAEIRKVISQGRLRPRREPPQVWAKPASIAALLWASAVS